MANAALTLTNLQAIYGVHTSDIWKHQKYSISPPLKISTLAMLYVFCFASKTPITDGWQICNFQVFNICWFFIQFYQGSSIQQRRTLSTWNKWRFIVCPSNDWIWSYRVSGRVIVTRSAAIKDLDLLILKRNVENAIKKCIVLCIWYIYEGLWTKVHIRYCREILSFVYDILN